MVNVAAVPGLPLVGNLLQLKEKKPYKTFALMAQKYGPIYSIRAGSSTIIVLNSTNLAKEVRLIATLLRLTSFHFTHASFFNSIYTLLIHLLLDPFTCKLQHPCHLIDSLIHRPVQWMISQVHKLTVSFKMIFFFHIAILDEFILIHLSMVGRIRSQTVVKWDPRMRWLVLWSIHWSNFGWHVLNRLLLLHSMYLFLFTANWIVKCYGCFRPWWPGFRRFQQGSYRMHSPFWLLINVWLPQATTMNFTKRSKNIFLQTFWELLHRLVAYHKFMVLHQYFSK